MARTPIAAIAEARSTQNSDAQPRRHRAPRTEPRKVSVLLRVQIELVAVTSDKRKLYDACSARRNLPPTNGCPSLKLHAPSLSWPRSLGP